MATLHLGTFAPAQLLGHLAEFEHTYNDKDCWEEWGEPRKPFTPHHIMVRHEDANLLGLLPHIIMATDKTLLMPMTYKSQRGVMASITRDDDFSYEILRLVDTQASIKLADIARNATANLFAMWSNADWLRYVGENYR